MTISLRKLQVFIRIAATGQVTRAAKELRLSQSAVSMALASLENEHGGPLFQRIGRRLILNDRGRMLRPYAEQILHQVDNLSSMLDDSQEQPCGNLHIGASTTIGNYLLPELIAKFTQRYHLAKVQLQIANSEQIAQAVRNGDLDLGLIEGPCHLDELNCIKWRDDELVVITAPEHEWNKQKQVERQQLFHGNWIVREVGSGTREVIEKALGCNLNSIQSTLELGHTEAIKRGVEAGLGVSCLSRLAVQHELDQKRLTAIATPLCLKRQLSLLLRSDCYQTKLVRAAIEILKPTAPICTAITPTDCAPIR
ncbi:MAG: LysR family transcriptional regulator [Desulfobacteraceae bacterium 4572_35.1]|nr:MAG: LysR family transcriptional regulator [Desulfobacteraceae bacterium 4572_35.1]